MGKEDDSLWMYGAVGALASLAIGLAVSFLGKSPPNFGGQTQSYQAQTYRPPPQKSGCGCSAGG